MASVMDLASESRRVNKAAEDALKDNSVSRMHDLIREWTDALTRANRHPKYRLAPFQNAFSSAIEEELHEMTGLLVQNGSHVELNDLVFIFQNDRYSMLETLLNAGWDANTYVADNIGDSLLYRLPHLITIAVDILTIAYRMVVGSNRLPMLKLLLSHGADPNLHLRAERYKAIELAAFTAGPDVIDALIEHGAELRGRQPLQKAACHGRVEIVEHLLNCGVDVDGIPDNEDVYDDDVVGTALHTAAAYGQKDVIVVLLGRGADKSLENSEGKTALEVAEGKGHTDIVRLLR